MADEYSRPYAIHSSTECERLEKQATLAGLPDHLRFVPVPPQARILDAGCGSGSMTRLLASTHRDIDLRADYISYASERPATKVCPVSCSNKEMSLICRSQDRLSMSSSQSMF
jgi:2-polyprenyl-3-methyl-5-hydroxy-6-metoxy-1,4-benzoquinol methylase